MKKSSSRLVRLSVWLIGLFFVAAGFQLLISITSAQEVKDYVFENVSATLKINEDSTVDVTETLTYRFTGNFHAVFREITLTDPDTVAKCKQNANLQCGGFNYLDIEGVYDNNNQLLDPSQYTVEPVFSGGENRLKLQWIFSQEGKTFNNETFSFSIKYKVYGSIGYFTDYDLIYWDAIFPDRDKKIEDADVTLIFPEDIAYKEDNLKIAGFGFDYDAVYNQTARTLSLHTSELLPYEDFTVLLKFPNNIVAQPASIRLKSN